MKRIILMMGILVGCQSQNHQNYIDTIIAKYETEDFSCLKNAFIHRRGADRSTITLMLSKHNLNCSPYVITVDRNTKSISKIENHLVKQSCDDYFTNNQISSFVSCFLKYDFVLLGVDEQGTVYINPNMQEQASIMRKPSIHIPKDISQFNKYRGYWYLRK